MCKCVRRGGQGKRTSISQLIECRYYNSPDMKQAIHSKAVRARGAFDSLARSAFRLNLGLYVQRERSGASFYQRNVCSLCPVLAYIEI